MTEPNMLLTTGGSLCLFDERGELLGTIDRPLRRDPLGPGRDTVYLARADEREMHHPAAA